MRVLIAEDDAVTRKIYDMILKQFGCEVDLAKNGREAIELSKRKERLYNLCIMDIEMPVMDGIEAIQLLRQDNSDLRIIAMSSSQGYKERSLAAGANDYCRKPISKETFLSLIK